MCYWNNAKLIRGFCSVTTLLLIFTLYGNNGVQCLRFGNHVADKTRGITGSLRQLSKAVFTKALLKGKTIFFYQNGNE